MHGPHPRNRSETKQWEMPNLQYTACETEVSVTPLTLTSSFASCLERFPDETVSLGSASILPASLPIAWSILPH